MFTEENLQDLSRDVYRIDQKHEKFDPKIKDLSIRKFDGLKYQILKTEDNPTNGMQAMAVAPVKNGQVDTLEVVIAFAGTNYKSS